MLNTTVNNKILISEYQFHLFFAGMIILGIIFIILAIYNFFIRRDVFNIITIIVAILNIVFAFCAYPLASIYTEKQDIKCYFAKPAKEEKKLKSEKIMEAIKPEANQSKVYDCILDLVNRNVYFDYVNKLLYIDDNFKVLWNDYNYYDAKSYSKKNQEERDKIEKYVFQKIYELKQQETN